MEKLIFENWQKLVFMCFHIFLFFFFLVLAFATTPEFLSKKHIKFDQGLDFLIFYQGNRGQTVERREKTNKK